MLLFGLVLGTTLVSSAIASSTPNTSVYAAADTCTTRIDLNPQIGVIGTPCHCYDNGLGFDRHYMIDAISEFCMGVGQRVWGSDSNLKETTVNAHWINTANMWQTIDAILVKQEWWADRIGNEEMCKANFTIDYYSCFDSMHVMIDQCNTGGENGKQGGYGFDACLLWTVDPNPSLNNKGIYSLLTTPTSVYPTPTAKPKKRDIRGVAF